MKRTVGLTILALAPLFPASPASATIVFFQPSATVVDVGDSFDIDVMVSDLDFEIVSAFDLDFTFVPAILTATNVTFGSFLGAPFDSFTDFDLFMGNVDFAELSLLSDPELDALQPESFVLATISFLAIGAGTTPLEFVPDPLFGIDIKGRGGAIHENIVARPGEVTVRQAQPAPEPGTLWLTLGLLGLLAARRRR